jgi:decaprenylphospho-beta-D-ribofuranose 2-oxidase
MSPLPPNSLDGILHKRETLSCYTSLYTEDALVYAPVDVAELERIFERARKDERRVTLRAGGHAFDEQAMGSDLVVLMTRLKGIEVDVLNARMTVGAGTTWGEVFDRLEPLGLVPFSTVTTRHATCGGTLASDCLSRFSPAYGKEAEHILSFDFLAFDGQRILCTPPAAAKAKPTWTLGERIFCAAIGGFGLLGAAVSITYALLHVGETDGKIGVESRLKKYRTYRDLARELVPLVREITERKKKNAIDRTAHPEAVFSALFNVKKAQYAILLHSTYTTSRARNRLAIHQPNASFRLLAECLLRSQTLNVLTWPVFYALLFRAGETYIDDLQGFTFFMDGNRNAKELGQSLGFAMKAIQQTFVVPANGGVAHVGWDEADERLAGFLERAHEKFESVGLEPTLFDVLFIPRDDRAFLSPSYDLDGFAVSYAFETSDASKLDRVKRCFVELSDDLLGIGGRVSLVKNVHADPTTLATMYADGIPKLRALKRTLDPKGLLRSDFIDRNLPQLCDPIGY